MRLRGLVVRAGRDMDALLLKPNPVHYQFCTCWFTISIQHPMDTLTATARSERMSRIRHKDTGPERVVRQLLSALGFRYRLHGASLAGRPDIVFSKQKKVVFVHGCFWHRHPGCGRTPKSRLKFWEPKLKQNRSRDLRNQRKLRAMGWRFLVIWECELRDFDHLGMRLIDFLDD